MLFLFEGGNEKISTGKLKEKKIQTDLQNYNLIGNYQIFKEYLRLKNRLDFCHHRLNRDMYP